MVVLVIASSRLSGYTCVAISGKEAVESAGIISKNTITIGIDHGYAAIKTKDYTFPTGVVGYDNEPYTQQGVLEYGGKFYVVGSGRQPLQKEKTATEDYYLMTLAGQEEIPGVPAPGRSAGILPV